MNFRSVRIVALLALLASALLVAPTAGATAPAAPDAPISGVTAISGGPTHTCVINTDRTVSCWGLNSSGQLGTGATASRDLPAQVPGLTDVVQIATGGAHTCALTSAGAVKCWGDSSKGQVGDGATTNRPLPVQVSGLATGVKAIAAGGQHTCAVMSDGKVRCWGLNEKGQLGINNRTDKSTPTEVVNLTGVDKIAAGTSHTCALTTAGAVKCWGANLRGQLGNGQVTTDKIVPVDTVNITNARGVTAGDAHTCAALTDGRAYCWGDNESTQLGANRPEPYYQIPEEVVGLSGVAEIKAGGRTTCARLNSGAVACWGDNLVGQVGDGSGVNRPNAVTVPGISGATAIGLGGTHVCVAAQGDALRCWGDNSYGQLADGTLVYRAVRADVAGLGNVTNLSSGIGHTCALMPDGTVKCWGNNYLGQLGDGTRTTRTTPITVPGLSSVKKVVAGGGHTCALMLDGSVKCWGNNQYSQLGDNTNVNKLTPVDVVNLNAVAIDLVAGYEHTCILTADTRVKCWGRNDDGQVGNGSGTQSVPMPASVIIGASELQGATSLAAGGSHTCAVVSGGVKCWGNNRSGQIGNGTTNAAPIAVDVTGLSNPQTVVAGGAHTCAQITDGTARCWGNNDKGQLGDGTTTQQLTPVAVVDLSGVQSIAAGGPHTCAITTGGVTRCWGSAAYGELGDWSFKNASRPVIVQGAATGATEISLGQSHTCVELGNQLVSCFGWDGSGQLGQGRPTQRLSPVEAQATMPAVLSLNYGAGKPGSEFLLTGHRFTPGETISFTINGTPAGLTLPTQPTDSGSFVIDVTTALSNGAGLYTIRATSGARSASATFRLDNSSVVRSDPGSSLSLSVAGVQPRQGFNLYLPYVKR